MNPLRYILILSLSLLAGASRADAPPITIGVDAQPMTNFDRVAGIANTLVRYDSGPQKSDTPADYLTLARIKKLKVEIQGTALDRFNVDARQFADVVTKIMHDDEPDLSRLGAPDTYTAANAPHPSTVGYTRPEVLAARYKAWKTKWPAFPVSANFNGQSLTSLFYAPPLAWHSGYIKATDEVGFDLHVRNIGKDPSLFQGAYLIEKLRAAGGNPAHAYIEASDQRLGRGGRGPTPVEQATELWSALGHGATEVIYFPQQIGGRFDYWAMTPENEQRAKDDFATINQRAALLATGTRTIARQTPAFAVDYNKGKATWPTTETFTWQGGNGEKLTVTIDYTGATAPVIDYAPPTPTTQPAPGPTPNEVELTRQLTDAKAELVTVKASLATTTAELVATRTERDVSNQQAQKTSDLLNKARDAWNAAKGQIEDVLNPLAPRPPPTTAPATKPLTVYTTPDDPAYLADQRGVKLYNYGHSAVYRPWVNAADVATKITKAQVQAWAVACRDGNPAFVPLTVDGQPGRAPLVVAKGVPTTLDYEDVFRVLGVTPDTVAMVHKHLDWFYEAYPDGDLALVGTPQWVDGDDAKTALLQGLHNRCRSLVTGIYEYRPSDFPRQEGESRKIDATARRLYPGKPVYCYVMPVLMDTDAAGKNLPMPPDLGARVWALATELSKPGDSIVLFYGSWAEKVAAYGDNLTTH